jgi:hypothetical protein
MPRRFSKVEAASPPFVVWGWSILENVVAVFLSGAEDGAATFGCSVGVPADESIASRHRLPRLRKILIRSKPERCNGAMDGTPFLLFTSFCTVQAQTRRKISAA